MWLIFLVEGWMFLLFARLKPLTSGAQYINEARRRLVRVPSIAVNMLMCAILQKWEQLVIPCYTMLYHVIPCYTMLYHVIPCYTMLYHVIPLNSRFMIIFPVTTLFSVNSQALCGDARGHEPTWNWCHTHQQSGDPELLIFRIFFQQPNIKQCCHPIFLVFFFSNFEISRDFKPKMAKLVYPWIPEGNIGDLEVWFLDILWLIGGYKSNFVLFAFWMMKNNLTMICRFQTTNQNWHCLIFFTSNHCENITFQSHFSSHGFWETTETVLLEVSGARGGRSHGCVGGGGSLWRTGFWTKCGLEHGWK